MIYLVSGPPGNGKSFYAARKVAEALEAGKPVAGNLELVADWPRVVVRRSWPFWIRWRRRRRFLREGDHLYHFSEELSDLTSLRLKGKGEGRGLMVLDEGHNWMNARSWSAEDRKEIVRFFSQHRKLGWDVLLIAQHPEMIDKQVRNLVEYNVYLRNLKKARWMGLPISPVNLFLAVWCWHSAQRVVVKREVFPLSWRKRLYDSYATSHGLAGGDDRQSEDDKLIWLPSAPEDRAGAAPPDARTRTAEPVAAARPEGAAASGPLTPSEAGQRLPSEEEAAEAGEPEAWPQAADYRRPE